MNRSVRFRAMMAGAAAVALLAGAAQANTTSSRDDWENAVGDFTVKSTFGTLYSTSSSYLIGSGVTATSSDPLQVLKVGDGWANGAWTTGYKGQILFSQFQNAITLTFSQAISAFSFLAAGNYYGTFPISLKVGSETLTQSVLTTEATGGGAFFGWYGSPITSLTISSPNNLGFAFGRVGVSTAAVPGPIAGAGLPALLGVLGFAAWRRRRAA